MSRAPPNGGNCTNRATTRRRHAGRMLLMVQNPHHYPRRHAPSLASCSFTSAGLPGGAPINAGRASPTEPGQGHDRPAPRRGLCPMRRNTPSVIIQPVLIGRNTLDQVESSLTGRMPPNGLNAPDQVYSFRWSASCLKRGGASAQARRPLPRRCQRPSRDQRASSYIRNSDTMFKRVAASPPGSDPRAGGPPFSYHAQVRRPRAQCPGQNRDVDQSLAATVGL